MSSLLSRLKFDPEGLIPAIAQQYDSGRVLMLALSPASRVASQILAPAGRVAAQIKTVSEKAEAEVPAPEAGVPPVEQAADEHVFLVGRPPIGEYLGFVQSLAINGHAVDLGELTEEWRKANDHVQTLETTEAGIADGPPIRELPGELAALAAELSRDPMFRRAFRFMPSRIALVELDRLMVFQKNINLRYVEELKARLGTAPSLPSVFRVALSLDRAEPPVRQMQGPPNLFSFLCPSNDLRFLEPVLLEPGQVRGFTSTGRPSKVIGLAVGFGSNYLNALHVDGRLILNNGSHRAYALRDLGLTEVPCIVQTVTRRDELELVASGDFQRAPDRYLKAHRPPLLKDYFDPNLRKIVLVQRKNRLVRVQIAVEQSDVPAE